MRLLLLLIRRSRRERVPSNIRGATLGRRECQAEEEPLAQGRSQLFMEVMTSAVNGAKLFPEQPNYFSNQ